MKMKCISLWQPWASLIAIDAKRIETRSWPTRYTGPLAIHAAKTQEELPMCWNEPFRTVLEEARLLPQLQDGIEPSYEMRLALINEGLKKGYFKLPLGAIVATCNLVACEPMTSVFLSHVSEQEQEFGCFALGRFGWVMEDVKMLAEPIPYRGQQGLFDVELDGAQ